MIFEETNILGVIEQGNTLEFIVILDTILKDI